MADTPRAERPSPVLSPPVRFAKLTDRFLAYLIDVLPFAAGFDLSLIALGRRGPPSALGPDSWRRLLWLWIGLYVAYHWVGNMAGATPGKWALGLRVRRRDGGPLGPGRSFLRALGLLASTPLFNLGFLWAFVQAESRTWHDLLAGSVVVQTRPKSEAESLWAALASFAAVAAIAAGTWRFYASRPTVSDVESVAKAQAGLRILAQIEDRYKAEHGTFTDRLADLAAGSGDAAQFREAMLALYDPKHFRIAADKDRYFLAARAKDRRRTVVTLRGP